MVVCFHIVVFDVSAYGNTIRGYSRFWHSSLSLLFTILSSVFMSSTSIQKDENGNEKKQQVIVVLEGACLETVKSKKVGFNLVHSFCIGICSPQC